MGDVFQTVDIIFFFVALVGVMAIGLIAGRKEETSEDYFLASRKIPWWGVAGSIYGSNVSANHMVGMMGVGFSIGFAQSHFELGAILGLMVLCYGFLPVYRKLNVFTLSEYLGRRYDNRSRVAYAIIMIIIMAIVQMVPGLYIGGRTICILLGGDAVQRVVDEQAVDPPEVEPPDLDVPVTDEDEAAEPAEGEGAGESTAETATDGESTNGAPADGASPDGEPANGAATKVDVRWNYYAGFVIALAVISAAYTIFGGLKAVIWTDFIQSMLLLAAGILIAILTFSKIGGWGEMMAIDAARPDSEEKMHLYLPSDHPQLPWTGVFTGLLFMHCYYWGTNQFIVQRALGARSDSEAKLGIVAAGFLKLLIPFFAIGTGVAAYYLFQTELPNQKVDSDAAFSELVKLVIPFGVGIMGLIGAGLIGAILSSIDSMMNSAATIVTVDIYRQFINPDATDRQMIRVGRLSIVGFVVLATLMALFVMDPNSEANFFLQIANYQNYFTPGLLVAFFLGMFWKRGTATGAFAAIVGGVFFSWLAEFLYNRYAVDFPALVELFGEQLNFFHRVVFVVLLSGLIHVLVSLMTQPDEEKGRLSWTVLGGHASNALTNLSALILLSIVVFVIVAVAMVKTWINPGIAACLGAAWTFLVFQFHIRAHRRYEPVGGSPPGVEPGAGEQTEPAGTTWSEPQLVPLLSDDRFWASVLCSAAVFIHYYYY